MLPATSHAVRKPGLAKAWARDIGSFRLQVAPSVAACHAIGTNRVGMAFEITHLAVDRGKIHAIAETGINAPSKSKMHSKRKAQTPLYRFYDIVLRRRGTKRPKIGDMYQPD